jgi:hypothetical protein
VQRVLSMFSGGRLGAEDTEVLRFAMSLSTTPSSGATATGSAHARTIASTSMSDSDNHVPGGEQRDRTTCPSRASLGVQLHGFGRGIAAILGSHDGHATHRLGSQNGSDLARIGHKFW